MALVITMAFLAIITILCMGFMISMRTERLAARSMAENERAKQVAQSALVHAISLLRDNIPDPTDPTMETPVNGGGHWYSNPGRLTVVDSTGVRRIALHTGEATADDSVVAVNLNARSVVSDKYPITGANDPMWVSWVPVLQDNTAPAGAGNKLVGRYAFWMDDESTKVNVNVARGKPASITGTLKLPLDWGSSGPRDLAPYLGPSYTVGATTYGLSHPASINADMLGLAVRSLETDIPANGDLRMPEDIRKYMDINMNGLADDNPTAQAAAYEAEKFNLTIFSKSPEFNVFGKSRIFLTKWAGDIETGAAYQHSYHPEQPMTFYAYTMGLATGEAMSVDTQVRQIQEPIISTLARYMQRNDWPGMEGSRFRWASAGPEESEQIAVNMNSMISLSLRGSPGGQGSGATGSNVCDDMDRKWGVTADYPGYTGPRGNHWKGPISSKGILALNPFPQINEVGVRLTPLPGTSASNWRLQVDVMQEVYLPPGYFRNTGAGTGMWTAPSGTSGYQSAFYAPYVRAEVIGPTGAVRVNTATNVSTAGSPAAWKGNPMGSAGPTVDGYAVLSMGRVVSTGTQFTNTGGSPNNFSRTGSYTVNVRVRVGLGANAGNFTNQLAPMGVPAAQAPSETVPAGLIASPESDGYFEFSFVINGAEIQDMIDDPTLRPRLTVEVDDPRTSGKKACWTPRPATEDTLGFVNTTTTADNSKLSKFAMWDLYKSGRLGPGFLSLIPTGMQRGVAWDTMRFHKNAGSASDLPDWLVMDLIAPNYGTRITSRNATQGKLNINSRIFPDSSPHFSPPQRTKPLEALFAHMPNGDNAAAALSAWQTSTQAFDHVGRITEVPGVADDALGATDFDKEVLIRNLAGAMTTQSNVFGVWGVAQTVRKKSTSTQYGEFERGDTVTGEKRFYAVVERYVWKGKDGIGGNGEVGAAGTYSLLATGVNTTPGPAFPPLDGYTSSGGIYSGRVQTSKASFIWPQIDGPQAPALLPAHGTVTYLNTPAEQANNPLAALMKYRIVYFVYLD
ncbi:hypothetical protein DB346_12775 [Verrucomicrobia bacterium LW23]|nr:hypothetical protein DB346_12775 [Verrucomicrobia bacterium LW23]